MKKSARITEYISRMEPHPALSLDPHYLGYFQCFNEQKYYEAHDVLEQLWLKKKDGNYHFFKGLIQVAGAFVHLQKQRLRPTHAKDGRRLRPASRLFKLAMHNLESYRPFYMHLDVESLHLLCAKYAGEIIASDYRHNPLRPSHPPRLSLDLEHP
jgi:predicted metal-dependent hydrolase